MLALCGLLVGLSLVLFPQDRERGFWSAGATRPLVDEWASFTEAGHAGSEITATSRPSRISQVTKAGRRAYEIRVLARDRDRYTTNAQRTELGQGNPTREFSDGTGSRKMAAGEERWVAEEILIPADTPTGHPGYGFFVINQFKQDGSGGPAVALSFKDDRLVVSRAASRAPRSAGAIDLGRTSVVVPRGRWVSVLWHLKWSASSGGLVEVFADLDDHGLRRFVRYRGWTLKRGSAGRPALVHPRVGIYRRAVDHNSTIYVSGFSVAGSRSDAETGAGL